MLLYSTHSTARLQYIVDFFSRELFDDPIVIITDKELFLQSPEPGLNYSDSEFRENEFFIHCSSLLFESDIRRQTVDCFELNYQKAFFQTNGDFPFDIFAASFYLLSRYEEYLPHETDAYGRFAHKHSLAFKEGFLNIPLVNIWLQDFKKALRKKFPSIRFRYTSFQFIPTYDIDIAYAYLHKGRMRNVLGLSRDVLQGKWPQAAERLKVLRGKQQDPFDAYEWLDSLHLYCRLKAVYFFLVAREQKGYDKNIAPDSEALPALIRYHASGYTIGVHPSWQSGDEPGLLQEELEWLSYITDRKIEHSRQHYIRMQLPETYRQLIDAGIASDFSMGYGSINGFRASVASSFFWFDLKKDEQTTLQVFPFCFMDANSFYEQQFSAQQAMDELLHYYNVIRKVNGLMVTIWHNSMLGTDPQFSGWREAYEIFLKEEVYWDM